MPNFASEDDGVVKISTTQGSIDEIMNVMSLFENQRTEESIPIELWQQALDAITSSINLLSQNARAAFIDMIMKSFDGKPKASVEFLTFVGSLLLVCKGGVVHGSLVAKTSKKQLVQFGVDGEEKMECLLKVSGRSV